MTRSRKFRFGIKTLMVSVAFCAGCAAYYSRVWHRLDHQWDALQRLESIPGDVFVLPPSQFLPQEASAIDWPVHFAFGRARVERLLAAKDIGFGDGEASEECIELLLQIPNIIGTRFGEKTVSLATFDRLTENGIKVDHWGLKDFSITENYVYNQSHYHAMDPEKMDIRGILQTVEGPFEFFAEGKSLKHKYASQHYDGYFETCEFGAGFDWKELTGRQFKPVFTDGENHGGFGDGLHHRLDHQEIRILSRERNVFRLEWNFNSEFGGASKAEFKIPFTGVDVSPYSGITTIAQAKEILSRQFDLNDFEEPVAGTWFTYHFSLKPALRSSPAH